jgi:hypothetical protein
MAKVPHVPKKSWIPVCNTKTNAVGVQERGYVALGTDKNRAPATSTVLDGSLVANEMTE